MIGDPSGRSSERNLLDAATLERNVAAIGAQLERFLDFSPGPTQAVMANNLDWLGKLSLIEYLRDVGKHFTVPYMLAKDSVQQRLDRGLSFTEFSYMTLQAYDFATLYREHGVEMQMGGADQWGNITAGLELIRRTQAATPRRARPTGSPTSCCCRRRAPSSARARAATRCGSIRPARRRTRSTSTGCRLDDRDVGDVPALVHAVAAGADRGARRGGRRPSRALARRRRALAFDVTARVHGEEAARDAQQRSRTAFQAATQLSLDDLVAMRETLPHFVLGREAMTTVLEFAIGSNAYTSKGEARRGMAGGGFYVNDVRVTDPNGPVPEPLHERFWLVRTGKRNLRLVEPAG